MDWFSFSNHLRPSCLLFPFLSAYSFLDRDRNELDVDDVVFIVSDQLVALNRR